MTPSLPAPDQALLDLAHLLLDGGYGFTTPTPDTHARVNARPENAEAQDLRGVFGWSRRFRPELLPPAVLPLLRQAGAVTEEDDGWCRSRLRLSQLHGMAFWHSAFPTAAADSVFFGPDTYRFADAIAAFLRERDPAVGRAADIGCGAGPGGLVVARHRPAAELCMLDINPAALRLARVNAALNGAARAEAVRSDMMTGVPGGFDLVVANPPYLVDPAERAYRHGGGPLGAALSLAMLDAALDRLNPGGTVLLYTGAAIVNGDDPFRHAAAGRLDRNGFDWRYHEADPDVFGEELDAPAYRGADRIAAVVLTATRTSNGMVRTMPEGTVFGGSGMGGSAQGNEAALHLRLSAFNGERFEPGLPGAGWREDLDRMAQGQQEEGEFLEARRAAVAARAAEAPTDADGFIAWFQALEQDGPGQNDPLFPWLATEATMEQMCWFLTQEVAGEAGFEDLSALTQVKLPIRPKLEIARNYWDEMGRGNAKGMHGPLLETLAHRLGLDPRPETTVWEALALANVMAGLAANRRYAYHSVGALGVIEQTAPARATLVGRGLKRLGVPAGDRHYFDLHAILDVKHSLAWNAEAIHPLVEARPEVAPAIAEGALMRLECGAACFERYRRELGLA